MNVVVLWGLHGFRAKSTARPRWQPTTASAREQTIDGSKGNVGSPLLDPAVGDDVRTLRAVLKVSQAVLGAHRFDDALEVIAEQTLAALGAASFSISRWERERGVLHTMINLGELGPGEERWPTNEEYPLADYRDVTALLRQGRPYVNTIDDDNIDPADQSVLRRLNKYSELAVPVMCDGAMWGELWAASADRRRFDADDIRLLHAIAAQISVAIGTSELFTEVSRYAYQDPLTGLANRRRLDECLRELVEARAIPPCSYATSMALRRSTTERATPPAMRFCAAWPVS